MIIDSIVSFFSSDEFMPHGHCFLWRNDILWTHLITNLLIAVAYYSIPFGLLYFSYKRKDLPFRNLFILFSAFITLCATGHLIDIVVLWVPIYGVEAFIKILTAVISLATAGVLLRIIPYALSFKGTRQLNEVMTVLLFSLQEKELYQQKILLAYNDIESQIKERKKELDALNEKLAEETLNKFRIEEELELTKERYTLSLKAMHDGLSDSDLVTGHVYRSPRLKEMLGLNDDDEWEESEDGCWKFIHSDDLELYKNAFHTAFMYNLNEFRISFRVMHKNGSVVWLLARSLIVRDAYGTPRRLVTGFTDITEFKLLEEKLRISKERYDLALKAMNDGIWDWDLRTNNSYFSPRIKELLEVVDEELKGSISKLQKYIHPDDITTIKYKLNALIYSHQGEEFKQIFRTYNKNGHIKWLLCRAILVRDEEGKPYRMVGGITDISELKRLEEELREALSQANIANKAKDEFLTNMSHEIRTPINAISGLGYVLLNQTSPTTIQKKYLEPLLTSTESLLSIVDQILDISRIETKKVEISYIKFNLRKLFNKIIEIYSLKAKDKHIQLYLEIDDELSDLYVIGDEGKIQQIVLNLVGNAVKFTDSGYVKISVHTNIISNHELQLQIIVSDTGIGISKEYLDMIFERFVQIDSSTSRKYGGTGLGLSICKELVKLLNGTISVTSEKNKGTEFKVILNLETIVENELEAA
jgi:PAS domain S-box-containing protein